MKIQLKAEYRGEFRETEVKEGTSIKTIADQYQQELSYRILLAKVENEYQDLNYTLERECRVELLDMRTWAASLTYQYSLCLIFLAAFRNVVGHRKVTIDNSLNQGLYIGVDRVEELDDEKTAAVEREMRRIVEEDLPIEYTEVTREEGLRIMAEDERECSIRRIRHLSPARKLKYYRLDGYLDYFYGLMVPSAGYIEYFELKRYKDGLLLRFPLSSAPKEIPAYKDQKKLYGAFKEQSRWDELLRVDFVPELNEKIESGAYKDLIMTSEALHEKKIAEIADQIVSSGKRIVLIAGPSSSGKTTFAQRLRIQMRVCGQESIYMGTDDYFVEREDTPRDENGEPNYEDLDAIDIDLFNRNMNDLLNGKEVDLPTFDFITGHKVFGKRMTRLHPHESVVIEGIHGLNEKLTSLIPKDEKFKIYISPLTQLNMDEHSRIPTTDERMLRRMVRDYQFRGHSAQMTIDEWPKVRAGEDVNIFPYSDEADVLFNSYHIYEISVLKKYAEPLLSWIGPDEPEYAEAQRMLAFLRPFSTIVDDSVIVNNSIIREFIGGSVFVQ